MISGPLAELGELIAARVASPPVISGEYPLSGGVAHEDLLARRTTGTLLLDPSRSRESVRPGGSTVTDERRTVRTVVEKSMPALGGVSQEGDRLLPAGDVTFERGDLRRHDRLRCRFRR